MKKNHVLLACGLALCLCLSACGDASQTPTTTEAPDPTVITETEAVAPPQSTDPAPDNAEWLHSTADPVIEMAEEKRSYYDNGTYYLTDVNADGTVRCIQSCYRNTIRENEPEDEYVRRRALGLSASIAPGTPYDIRVEYQEEMSKTLGYPVYIAGYFTGSDQSARCWLIYLTRTENYSYQYAFVSEPQIGILNEPKFIDYFKTLTLEPMAE